MNFTVILTHMLREKQKEKIDVSTTYLNNTAFEPSEQLAQQDSTRRQCRICLQQNDSLYISPCMCAGSIGFVHSSCMKYQIYRHFQGNILRKLPTCDYMRISCQMCNREIRFQFDIHPRIDCSPCSTSQKTKAWSILLILMIVFSILLAALLIIVIYYYTEEAGRDLFRGYSAGIWIVIAMVPLVTVALFVAIYYFVAENLYGNLVVVRVMNRGEKVGDGRKKAKGLFDYERYSFGESE